MTTLSSNKTVAAKLAFKQFSEQHGITIQHYHCNNGRFADNDFKLACKQARQRLTFCGVNTHFQNGIAKKAIWDLLESAHNQLLHARQRWPAAIHLSLWPYALRNAYFLHNTLPTQEDATSQLEAFSLVRISVKMRHLHTFGCPVFALQNELASEVVLCPISYCRDVFSPYLDKILDFVVVHWSFIFALHVSRLIVEFI
jgi:hypothetical protein